MKMKYELTNETINFNGYTLHRIKALKNFSDVKKGDLGGFIEKEENLSHEGYCWVYDNALVFDGAKVCGNAWVRGNAMVCGNAEVCNNARVYGDARVFGNARVYENAKVYGDAHVFDNATIFDNADISKSSDYCYISNFGSRKNNKTTFFKCKDKSIKVKCGCFNGTLDEFRTKVKETHGDNKYAKEYLSAIEMVKNKFSK